jgi:uncharacterized protein YybS (DUF2232 family)
VNRTVEETSSREESEHQRQAKTPPSGSLVLPGAVAYPVLQFGGSLALGNALLAVLSVVAAYCLCVYLYYGITGLVYYSRMKTVVAGALVAGGAGIVSAGPGQPTYCLANLAMLFLGGGLVGSLVSRGKPPVVAYAAGVAVLVVLGLVAYLPLWPLLMESFRELSGEAIDQLEAAWSAGGMAADRTEEALLSLKRISASAARLIPGVMIMSAVVQFSVGFLLFYARSVEDSSAVRSVLKFTSWRVPFGVAPLVMIVIIIRLLGGESLKLIADNAVLILSVYYCLGGIALIEFYLKRMSVPAAVRILFYVFLTFTGIVGYAITAILGFVDSFADWRKEPEAEIDLKKQ